MVVWQNSLVCSFLHGWLKLIYKTSSWGQYHRQSLGLRLGENIVYNQCIILVFLWYNCKHKSVCVEVLSKIQIKHITFKRLSNLLALTMHLFLPQTALKGTCRCKGDREHWLDHADSKYPVWISNLLTFRVYLFRIPSCRPPVPSCNLIATF